MTENKRFYLLNYNNYPIYDSLNDKEYNAQFKAQREKLCLLLNELSEEKDDWKNNCLISVSENSILWNEISILMEQGAEPSQPFRKYLNGLKNKNERFKDNVK